jgi:hypothetical protein
MGAMNSKTLGSVIGVAAALAVIGVRPLGRVGTLTVAAILGAWIGQTVIAMGAPKRDVVSVPRTDDEATTRAKSSAAV